MSMKITQTDLKNLAKQGIAIDFTPADSREVQQLSANMITLAHSEGVYGTTGKLYYNTITHKHYVVTNRSVNMFLI